jgi:hypothetical protein
MTLGRNDCPNPACDRTKPRDKAFCLPCWRQIPHAVQELVYASYRNRDLLAHVDYLDRLGERLAAGVGEWPTPEPPERACRVCGCTEDHACDFGCWWVEADLCSACVPDRQGEPIR